MIKTGQSEALLQQNNTGPSKTGKSNLKNQKTKTAKIA